jgi:hypothetical protein
VTAAAALSETSGSDAAAVRHLVVVFNPNEADRAGPAFYPLLLASKRPLTEDAAQELTSRAENLGFTVMFAPYTHEDGPFGKVARGAASLDDIQAELEGGVFTPPTDARPFFFEMADGLPRELVNTWWAVAVLVTVVAAGFALATRLGLVSPGLARGSGFPLIYFAVIGIAFMLVEISLLARLSLFLGHPTIAVAVVLTALLLASGAGSLLSARVQTGGLGRAISMAAAGTATFAIVAPLAVEQARPSLGDLPFAGRLAVVVVAIAPLGLVMGVLFPSGLRLTNVEATLPWAVNGVASVVGAVLAMTVALQLGYPIVSLTGAVLYAVLALAGPALLQGHLGFGWMRLEARGKHAAGLPRSLPGPER